MTDNFQRLFGQKDPVPQTRFAERVRPNDAIVAPAPNEEQTQGSGPYRAFGYLPVGFGESCDLRRWIDGTDRAQGTEVQYRFIMQIGYVGDEEIRLFLPDCIVVIEGKNLTPLRERLRRRQCTFIQQHNLRIWPGPSADDALIERIEVVRSGTSL